MHKVINKLPGPHTICKEDFIHTGTTTLRCCIVSRTFKVTCLKKKNLSQGVFRTTVRTCSPLHPLTLFVFVCLTEALCMCKLNWLARTFLTLVMHCPFCQALICCERQRFMMLNYNTIPSCSSPSQSADSVSDVIPAGCHCLSACAVPRPASAVAAAEVDLFGPVLSVQHKDNAFKYITYVV